MITADVASLDEIRENDHNLNITRYIQTDPPRPPEQIRRIPTAALLRPPQVDSPFQGASPRQRGQS